MGLFGSKKVKKEEKTTDTKAEPSEMKCYIKGAGGSIVSKSILNGTSKLKWLFREESEHGNGWIAFGDTDTQEYVNNAENMAIVDFNTLANIEPAVLNVFYMPVGSDLEFREDKSGKYFVDTGTEQEIREAVKHPVQLAFEKNLKFLNQETYPADFFRMLFTKSDKIEVLTVGETDFPTGEVVLADPLAYLGSKYETVLDKKVPVGSYPVELSVCRSKIAGLRITAAKIVISDKQAACYELAMPKGHAQEDLGKPNVLSVFGVDTGLACIADLRTAQEYREFFEKWHAENPGKNKYDDYFAALFRQSFEMHPTMQNEAGDFLQWQIPQTEHRFVLFSSGMGDGIYSGYWGLDEEGEIVSLEIPFMNPEYF